MRKFGKIGALLLVISMLSVLFVLPADAAITAGETETVIPVTWNYGYIASATHSTKPHQIVKSSSSGTYRYSDVMTFASKGTTITFYDPTGHASSNAYVFSSWCTINGLWALDTHGVNFFGISSSNKAINSTIQTVDSSGGVTYTYTTWKDNESLRLCYCCTGNPTDPEVKIVKNGAEPTINRPDAATLAADGTVQGIKWFCGYIGSSTNAQNCVNALKLDAGGYTFSDLILIPKKGTKISFQDASPFASAAAWVISSWVLNSTTGGYTVDTESANYNGSSPEILASTSTSSRKDYEYVTYKDNELIRLCYQSGTGNGALPATFPVVRWEETTQTPTFTPGSSHADDTFYPESPAAPWSPVTHTPLAAREIADVKWNYGYVGSSIHSSYANQIKTGGSTYMYSDVITIPKAGTTVYFFDDDFTDVNGNTYASANAAIFSSWKKSGSTWVVDTTKENPNGADASQITVGRFKQYSYTTVEDNENLRLCYLAPTSDPIMPPRPYKVYASDSYTFDAAGTPGKTAEGSYVNAFGRTFSYKVYLPADYSSDYFGPAVFSFGPTDRIASALAGANEECLVFSAASEDAADAALFVEDVLNAYRFNRTFSYLVSGKVLTDSALFTAKTADTDSDPLGAGKKLLSQRPTYYENLEKITMYAMGDSYFAGEALGKEGTWVNHLGNKYGMTFVNYGIGGSTASDFVTDHNPMVRRYEKMADGDASVILLEGGRNDRSLEVPLGTNDSRDTKTFLGAMNVMIDAFLKKYPHAVIVLVTPWHQTSVVASTGYSNVTYANALRDLAAFRNDPRIYCIYAADVKATGIDMDDAACRTKYCISSSDVSHLNPTGMAMIQPFMEKHISTALANYQNSLVPETDPEASVTDPLPVEEPTAPAETTGIPEQKKGCRGAILPLFALVPVAALTIKKKKRH